MRDASSLMESLWSLNSDFCLATAAQNQERQAMTTNGVSREFARFARCSSLSVTWKMPLEIEAAARVNSDCCCSAVSGFADPAELLAKFADGRGIGASAFAVCTIEKNSLVLSRRLFDLSRRRQSCEYAKTADSP